ncbi:MAG: guanylate kinase, partial [Brevundimonas sp.]|nr:guanylate kinase [Brevundimonas sp.]
MSNDRMPRRGVLLIVASPSGAGKTSLCRRLMADHGGLELSVSMTTRTIRPGEQAGRDYHFVDETEFRRLIEADAFLEWANV